jgi:hypothetical protein
MKRRKNEKTFIWFSLLNNGVFFARMFLALSSTERVVEQPSGQSSTVATSQPGTTTVTTNP